MGANIIEIAITTKLQLKLTIDGGTQHKQLLFLLLLYNDGLNLRQKTFTGLHQIFPMKPYNTILQTSINELWLSFQNKLTTAKVERFFKVLGTFNPSYYLFNNIAQFFPPRTKWDINCREQASANLKKTRTAMVFWIASNRSGTCRFPKRFCWPGSSSAVTEIHYGNPFLPWLSEKKASVGLGDPEHKMISFPYQPEVIYIKMKQKSVFFYPRRRASQNRPTFRSKKGIQGVRHPPEYNLAPVCRLFLLFPQKTSLDMHLGYKQYFFRKRFLKNTLCTCSSWSPYLGLYNPHYRGIFELLATNAVV